MADKHLTEAEWAKFSKAQGLKDPAVTKALDALDAAKTPAEEVKALQDLEVKCKALGKTAKKGDALSEYLLEMGKALDKRLNAAQVAAKAAAKAEAKSEAEAGDEGDEEAGAAWLEPKALLKQLKLCKMDPDRSVAFAYIDGPDKDAGVVVMSARLEGSALLRKLVAELKGAGRKTSHGTAWVDGTSLCLQLDKPLSGLVKKMREPVKACGFKASKIVLWNADGTVFEQDDEAAVAPGAQAGTQTPAETEVAAEVGADANADAAQVPSPLGLVWANKAPTVREAVEAALKGQHAESTKLRALIGFASEKADGQGDFAGGLKALEMIEKLLASTEPLVATPTPPSQAVAYAQRLRSLMPQLKAALQSQHPEASKLRATSGFASEKAADGQYAAANKALDMLEKLLDAASATAASDAQAQVQVQAQPEVEADADADAAMVTQASAPPPPPGPSAVKLTQARLDWERARRQVRAELERLEQAILAAVADEPDAATIRASAPDLYEVLEVADESLIDILDELLNAEEPARRFALRQQAAAKVEAYGQFVATDPLVQEIDANPFLAVKVRSTLEATLQRLKAQLT